ncbi:MAG: hypothetical protein IKM20_00345 [Erysipelotrichales bacterium]|nr:hypothetical protein [Erysipelotrichales bacterium]
MTRVTQKAINRTYLSGYNKNLSAYNTSINKMNTGRSFLKVSENVSGAARTYKVRKALSRDEQYIENIEDLSDRIESAEDGLRDINEYIQTVQERLVQAQGTASEEEYKVLAREIDDLVNNCMQAINNSNTGVYVFATNVNEPPFTLSEKGELFFRDGTNVNEITDRLDHETDVYADIGAGMTFEGDELNTASVTANSVSALECLGYGTTNVDGTTYSNNVISLLQQVADTIRTGDREAMGKIEGFLDKRYKDFVVNLTNVGNTSKFLDDCKSRIENEVAALTERQNDLEAVDYAEEAIVSQTYYMAYQISIQMGSKILPKSIFSFI